MSTVLGIRIDELTFKKALAKATAFFDSATGKKIFTPNPEMLVKAKDDLYFKEVLNGGDLNICDGTGISLVTLGKLKRIPGIDFMLALCNEAEQKGQKVYLLGSGNDMVVKRTAEVLRERFPDLAIVGMDKGPNIQEDADGILVVEVKENERIIKNTQESEAQVLFVAFGMGKQEKWIHDNLQKMPSVKVAMGVGGSFDYISGMMPRAPLLLRNLGLEWAYRLFKQPRRIGRIWNATVRFVWLILTSR